MKIKRGSTSVRRLIYIADSSSTTGAGLTGLVYNSAGLTAYYMAGDLSGEIAISLATATLGSYTSGGFVEVDATNMPGWYEIGIPDAALDAGNEVAIQFKGATDMVPVNIYIELDTVDYQTAAFGANTTTPLDASGVRIAVGLSSANLDTQLADLPTVAEFEARTLVSSAYFDPATDTVANVTLVATCTTNTDMRGTDSAYTGTPPTVGAIADQVWEEAIIDHSGTSGSVAEALNAAGSAGDPWTTALPGSYTTGQAGKILADVLADTAEMQGELADGGRLDLIFDAIQTAVVTTIPALLPSALVGGKIDASVGAYQSGQVPLRIGVQTRFTNNASGSGYDDVTPTEV